MKGRFEELAAGHEAARMYANRAADAPGVVVFHPWWGLNDDVVAWSDRLAASGFSVVAPDLVRSRLATTIEEAEHLSSSVDDAHATAVALAAIDRLAAARGASKVGAVGFSMGAPWALWCAAERPSVGASVVYYGTMGGPSLARASVPVLGHFAESDPYEPDDSVRALERALRDAGRSVAFHRYAGTGHWFAEPSRDAFRPDAAELAFTRTVTFLREHLKTTV